MVVDHPSKTIYVHNQKGEFVKRISFKKLGEEFYPYYDESANQLVFAGTNKNYKLTPSDKIKIELNIHKPRNRKYFKKYIIDLDDSTFTIRKSTTNSYEIINAYPYYDDYYLYGNIKISPLYKDSAGHELVIYRNNRPVKTFFPYNRIKEPKYSFTTESIAVLPGKKPDERMITRPFCDTIYKLVRDSIYPVYQLILPLENTFPPSFFSQGFKNKTERENFQRNNGWAFHQVYTFYETGNYITLFIAYNNYYENYLYNKENGEIYNFKNIKSDSTQYNLQLFSGFDTNFSRKRYKLLQAGQLIDFFQHYATPPPPELKAFLAGNPKRTAPILAEYQLKN